MNALKFLKVNLRESLLKGLEETIAALKKIIPVHSPKYGSLILIQSRFLEVQKKYMHGTISDAEEQLQRNQIRASLMSLIDSIEEKDLEDNPPTESIKSTNHITATPASMEKVQEKSSFSTKNWKAELVAENGLELLHFKVHLTEKIHDVKLTLVDTSTTHLHVNGQLVFEEKLNVFNALKGFFVLLTSNEESIKFVLADNGHWHDSVITYGVDVSASKYKNLRLSVGERRIFARG